MLSDCRVLPFVNTYIDDYSHDSEKCLVYSDIHSGKTTVDCSERDLKQLPYFQWTLFLDNIDILLFNNNHIHELFNKKTHDTHYACPYRKCLYLPRYVQVINLTYNGLSCYSTSQFSISFA